MKSATATPMPPSFDAYLRYAIETRFAYFGGGADKLIVSLLVRLKPGVQPQEFERQLSGRGTSFVIGPMEFEDPRMQWPADTAFLTVQAPVSLVMNEWDLWTLLTCWVKLSMPVRAGLLPRSLRLAARPKSQSSTVLAVIDDGCAFAHERFRVAPQDSRSRVFAIWDQDPRDPASLSGMPGVFGQLPTDFPYGVEYRRASAAGQIGIDDWIAAHRTADGRVDEEACYRDAGFTTLSRRVSHGAHVMDLLAGRVPPSARFSVDPRKPPSFKPDPANDVAGLGATDIIFVQIPRAAVDDPTGGWLDMQVTHAMFYILSCIDPNRTKRVIVNLSYGPTTGPHDGNSILEHVLCAFTALFNGGGTLPELNIVLPAGNSRLRDWRLGFTFAPGQLTRTWTWRVPPDNPVPVFAEIWVSPADAPFVTSVRAIAPSTAATASTPGPIVERAQAPCSDSRGWLIVLPPTRAVPTVPVPGQHGDWTIEVKVSKPGVKIDAYIARSDPNMGARIPGKPTRFLDLQWERDSGAFARQTLKDGAWDVAGSRIDRKGTLNGIGTVQPGRILVAAGYRLRDGVSSRYSSQGPSRGVSRHGPDHALPTDECAAPLGIRAAGNRSAAVFRLVGTSSAAPQLARLQARANRPGPCGLPTPAADVGCGNLDAP